MNQHYYIFSFGEAGTITPAIPNDTDPSGFVSYQQGWTFDYQRNLLTDPAAKSPTYTNFNALLSDVTINLQNYQQNGTPEFITTSDNGGTPYSYRINAIVRYSAGGNAPFGLYLNTVDNNTNIPTATSSGWVNIGTQLAASRIKLTGNLNLYVSTTGSDAANGLTTGTAFATLQHAFAVIYNSYDLNGFTVTVNLLAGAYTAGFQIAGSVVGGNLTTIPIALVGAGSTTTTINVTNSNCVNVSMGANISVSGVLLEASGTGNNGNAISISLNGQVSLGSDVNFGACSISHVNSVSGGFFNSNAEAYTVSGAATQHITCVDNGGANIQGSAVSIPNNLTFSASFVNVNVGGFINAVGFTYGGGGAVTGVKYNAVVNGVIYTNGGGSGVFPGSSAGTTGSGGQYV
jgi:hypothetical protein